MGEAGMRQAASHSLPHPYDILPSKAPCPLLDRIYGPDLFPPTKAVKLGCNSFMPLK